MNLSSGHSPLVWFTTLAIAGAGMIAVAAWHLPWALTGGRTALATGTLALAAGLLVSIGHLGRKRRAPLAARGVGRSALSHEVAFAGATLAAGAVLYGLHAQALPEPWIRIPTGVVALFCLLSIGNVYRVGGQRTWRGATVWLPLTAGLVCGEMFLWATGDVGFEPPRMTLWLVSLDAIVYGLRWRMLIRHAGETTSGHLEKGLIHRLSATRLLLVDLMPFVFLSIDAAPFAFVAVSAGLVFDRWLFYELADQHTTESELARVEARIERDS